MDSNLVEANTILKPLCEKVNMLLMHTNILKCMKGNSEKSKKTLSEMSDRVKTLCNDLEELTDIHKESKDVYEKSQVQQIEISNLLYRMKDVQVEPALADSCYGSSFNDVTNGSSEEASAPYTSCSPLECPRPYERTPVIGPQRIPFDIPYLSEEEFKAIPKYMAGRLSLEQINNFIDLINEAVSKKYTLMGKPESLLKTQELQLYRKYKQQSYLNLKGNHFILVEDLARECESKKLDKRAFTLLTILRHTKRLIHKVIQGTTVYIVSRNDCRFQ